MVVQVTICGGGNGAHTAAGYIGAKEGIKVNVFTRRPDEWNSEIVVKTKGSSWEHKGEIVGKINKASSNPAEVVPGSDIIIVCAPANVHASLLAACAPFCDTGVCVGTLYSQGGFDWAARKGFGEHYSKVRILFGMLNIPWICNLFGKQNYGKTVTIIGPKQTLWVAASPPEKTSDACEIVETLFDIPARQIPNFLSLTLTPSNQIIHPPRYYSIFKDWDGKKGYTREQLAANKSMTLYADLDTFSAEQITALDTELQCIKAALLMRYPQLDLTRVMPIADRIVDQYGPDVTDRSSLKQIFATNLGYAGCATPMMPHPEEPGKVIPVVKSRLFDEDIPYGLVVLKDIAQFLQLPTPRMDFYIKWYQQFMNKEYIREGESVLNPEEIVESGAPSGGYGITSLFELVQASLPKGSRDERSVAVAFASSKSKL